MSAIHLKLKMIFSEESGVREAKSITHIVLLKVAAVLCIIRHVDTGYGPLFAV
jgi:hypothetical protein